MRSIECEGDSIDEAIETALRTLEVARERVQIEILADATRGLFGLGGKKARVRATVRAPLGKAFAGVDGAAASPSVSRETPRVGPRAATSGREPATPLAVPDAIRERSRELLGEMLSLLGASCTVEASADEDPGTIVLQVSGDSGGLLIGRRGQTLEALEYMMNRIVRRDGEPSVRVRLDVERYRERRREYLDTLARRLAAKAKQTGRVVTLNPMSPRDRRVVHLALQGDAAVVTRSHGEGHFRKLLILPADRARRRPNRSAD